MYTPENYHGPRPDHDPLWKMVFLYQPKWFSGSMSVFQGVDLAKWTHRAVGPNGGDQKSRGPRQAIFAGEGRPYSIWKYWAVMGWYQWGVSKTRRLTIWLAFWDVVEVKQLQDMRILMRMCPLSRIVHWTDHHHSPPPLARPKGSCNM